MYPELLKRVKTSGLIEAGDRIIVGVSGGVDSVVLLDALAGLTQEYGLKFCIAHVNYGLRGKESDRDEKFVARLAKKYGYKFFVTHNPPFSKGGRGGILSSANLQNSARNIRYNFFLKTAKKFKANKIAIAHHADDQAETILLHLIRGSGPGGLAGMTPIRGVEEGIDIIRPLLSFTKKKLLIYAKERKLKFVQDSTNKTLKYHRNVIRHDLLPLLRKYNPNVVEHLCKTAAILRDENEALDGIARSAFAKVSDIHNMSRQKASDAFCLPADGVVAGGDHAYIAFKRPSFIKYSIAIRRRILRLAYAGLTGDTKDLLTDHVEHMLQIIESTKKVGAYSLPHKVKFIRKMGKISLIHDV